MDRRALLRSAFDAVATAAAAGLVVAVPRPAAAGEQEPDVVFDLRIDDVSAEMVDGTPVNMIGYRDRDDGPTMVPGPVLKVVEGQLVEVRLENRRRERHGFAVTGVPESRLEVAARSNGTVRFVAPPGGTYMYHDPTGDTPLYRLLGLHGAFVVVPTTGTLRFTTHDSPTPYSLDRLPEASFAAMASLFGALGTTDRFRSYSDYDGVWKPAPFDRAWSAQEKIWVCSQVDPRFNALVLPGQPIKSSSLTTNIVANWRPRYFTINNRSGFDLHLKEDVVARNYIGEPTLIRSLNAGLCHHAMHLHGNHVMDLAWADLDPSSETHGGVLVSSNVMERDVWPLAPMERRDVLIPYEIPPDIPFLIPIALPGTVGQFDKMAAATPTTQERLPLRYVMHCHVEMSQTAAGGNYPQGMTTQWMIVGGLGGRRLSGDES